MRGGISDEEKRDRARAARERLRRGDHGRRVRSEERGSVSAARGAAASDGMSASPDEVSAPSEERTHLLDRLQPDEERDLPPVVCDAESAPEGPPWHYDLSDEERAAREEKRETRQEKRDRLKQKALNKTPDKLRNPSDLQVRFRTGVIYTAATVICVLAGNIPMVLMLMVVAGICAGEFFYMLRSDAKLPNEMLGIIAAVLYPLSVYIAGLVGAMLVAMFSLDWRMALVAIMIFPVVLVVMVIYQRYSTPIVRRVRAYLADINDGFNEIINGMSVIQQFRQQARFGERMGEASRSHYMARMQTLRLDGFLLRPLLSLFSSLILCGLLMLFGFSASGTIEVGVLYAFISYLGRLNEPLIELTTQQAMLQQAVVAGERVFELMDGPRQQYGNDDRPLQSGTIEVDNVSFAYRDDNLVLKNINLSVPSRNFVALVGHTGSGKSTLASLLMGYYPLTEGEIRLDGRPLSTLSHSALRQGVAMVQQDPVVLADTFLANVTLGRDISEERVWQALETVQLAELARSMSDGIYTLLGEQGNNLSVGQKQLLALARVLVETPQILILDEATASIDSGTEQAIQHALAAVREHTTLVVIAHRLSTIVDADTILVLHRGQAVEQGTHQQLLAAQGRYWQMYQLQLAGEELAASVREEESLSA